MRKTTWVLLGLGCIFIIGNDVGGQPGGFGKKKVGGPDSDLRAEIFGPGPASAKRWEYLVRQSPGEADMNKLGDQGWELVAIEPADRPRGIITGTYVFKRPATGKPKADDRPEPKPAPMAKDSPRPELRLYQLKNASAPDMVALIDEVLSINRGAMRVTADRRTNQVIVNAPAEIHLDIEALLQRLDVAGAEKDRPGEAGPMGVGGVPGFGKKKK